MGVAGDQHRNTGTVKRGIERRDSRVVLARVVPGGVFRMADDCHRKLAAGAFEGFVKPCPLAVVDGAQDARVDREESEIAGLQLKERAALQAVLNAIELAQPLRLAEQTINTLSVGARQIEVGPRSRR
jgi:hypothetical protein